MVIDSFLSNARPGAGIPVKGEHSATKGAFAVAATLLLIALAAIPISAAGAASRNELVATIRYDGTPTFNSDPRDDTTQYPSPHTPGLDARPDNGVVRSYDTFGIRLDWNINEQDATNVVLEVTLPEPELTWKLPDAANPPDPAVPAGCLTAVHGVSPTSSISSDGRTLICNVGDQTQGSNGSVLVDIGVGGMVEGATLAIPTKLTTDSDKTGVVDEVAPRLVISSSSKGDWVKGSPTVIDGVSNLGVEGDVYLYPLTFSWSTGSKGSEPVNTAVPMVINDHPWDLPGAVYANGLNLGGRAACGQWDGPNALATNGVWSCTKSNHSDGYPVVQITIDNSALPTLGTAGQTALHGQVAFWVPQTELDIVAANSSPLNTMINSITGSKTDSFAGFDKTTDDAADSITPIAVPATFESSPETSVTNNTATVTVVPPGTGGGGGGSVSSSGKRAAHNIDFVKGSYAQHVYPSPTTQGVTWTGPDFRDESVGGMVTNGETTSVRNNLGPLPISRGQTFTISAGFTAQASGGSGYEDYFHGCVYLDTDNYELIPFGTINQYTVDPSLDSKNRVNRAPTVSTTQISASDGPLAHVLSGTTGKGLPSNTGTGFTESHSVYGNSLDYVVEFGVGAEVPQSIGEDQVTCNDSDATWYDSGSVSAAQYSSINRVRIRMLSPASWDLLADGINPADEFWNWDFAEPSGAVMRLFLQAKVKDDIAVQIEGEELFAFASRGFGQWDSGAGQPSNIDTGPNNEPMPGSCQVGSASYMTAGWVDDNNTLDTTTGWCNEPYVDNDVNGPTDFSQESKGPTYYPYGAVSEFHADKFYITAATLTINKTNLAGPSDVADNGDLVQFGIDVGVAGSTTEALTNIVLTDNLKTTAYEFVRFLSQPSGAPPCVESDDVITCQFSEPDPNVDSSPLLPTGRAGGWSDRVEFEVRKVSSIAEIPVTIDYNEAQAGSVQIGRWDPGTASFTGPLSDAQQIKTSQAYSILPGANIESAIIKTLPTIEGPCTSHPTSDPVPTNWGDRCQMIDFDGPMSFALSIVNEGNTSLSDIRFVDVFPFNGDDVEPASDSQTDGVDSPTLGDGRTPPSSFVGDLSFVSATSSASGATTVWVSGDDPATISRDPNEAITETTWCDTVGGSVMNKPNSGSGTCPTSPADVSAIYTSWDGQLNPADTYTVNVVLDTEASSCDDFWTNNFGARTADIKVPIRSNDVSVMVNCEYDLALRKTINPSWTRGDDYLTPGVTTAEFLLEVINQGDPVEDFDITDYVDTESFEFLKLSNPKGTTLGDAARAYTWDSSDKSAPVVTVDGKLDPGQTLYIPVNLRIARRWAGGPLVNKAEISRFDSDGDPTTGDSDPSNPDNPSTGALVDIDSFPDDTDSDVLVDDIIDNSDDDEDDHDVAELSVFDLALRKSLSPDTNLPIAVGDLVTFNIEVINQGSVDATNPTVIDRVDLEDWDPFEPGVNPKGVDTTARLQYRWTAQKTDGVLAIEGTLAAGKTAIVPVTLRIRDGADLAFLANNAEITGAVPTRDDDGDSATPPVTVTDENNKPLTDIDSTPDAKPGDVLVDDVVDNTGGDEDDEDIAYVAAPTYSLGNQIWMDSNNNGLIDPDESPVGLVAVSLFRDSDGDGEADDTNNDGIVDADDAIATTTTDSDGGYLFTGLEAGDYVVGVDPSNWDVGGPLYGTVSSFPTETDTNNDADNDDNGATGPGGYVFARAVTLNGYEPVGESGLANDPNTADTNSNTTVDFGFWNPRFDLALRKTVKDPAAQYRVGDEVTFNIEVVNQGDLDATEVSLIDYLPPHLQNVDPDWMIDADGESVRSISQTIPAGQSAVVTIKTKLVDAPDGPVNNSAEITAAQALGPDGGLLLMPNGAPFPDIDSVADADNTDPTIDDEISGPRGEDEDDHDVASITVTSNDPTTLAFTGSDTTTMLWVSLATIVVGLVLLKRADRRRI